MLRLPLALTTDHQIIRITNQRQFLRHQHLIHFMQINIGQQRRQHAPLACPRRRRHPIRRVEDIRLQPPFNVAQDQFILHLTRHQPQQTLAVDAVKTILDIRIHHPMAILIAQLL